MGVREWAAELTKKVYDLWTEQFPTHAAGFKVFSGHVLMNPNLMIISLNPGGNEEAFREDRRRFESGDFFPENFPPYLYRTYTFARSIRELLGKNVMLLEKSVAFRICFFRSKTWKTMLRPLREHMLDECQPYAIEIKEKLDPRGILLVSSKAFRRISLLPEFRVTNVTKLIKEGTWGKTQVFAIHHFRYHYTTADLELLRREFEQWLQAYDILG